MAGAHQGEFFEKHPRNKICKICEICVTRSFDKLRMTRAHENKKCCNICVTKKHPCTTKLNPKSVEKTAKYSVFEKYFYKIRKKVVVATQKVTVKRCYCHARNKLNQSELREKQ